MSTQSKLNANRANAKKSTGPRTAAGKAASSRNGLKHGLCSADPLLPDEDPADFEALHQDLIKHFHPIGESEEKLVMRIAAGQWRLDRVFPMEAGIFRDSLDKVARNDIKRQENYEWEEECAVSNGTPSRRPPAIDPSDALARAFKTDVEGPNTLAKLNRYESAIERTIDRSLRQLKTLQQARQATQPPADTTTCKTKPSLATQPPAPTPQPPSPEEPAAKSPATSHQPPATAAPAARPLDESLEQLYDNYVQLMAQAPQILIDLDSTTPVNRQIVDHLRALLVEGIVAPSDALPSVRRLAIDLGVHFNTVAEAYRTLADEGWLDISQGRAVRVRQRPSPNPNADAVEETLASFRRRLRQLVAEVRAQGLSPAAVACELVSQLEVLKS